MAQGMERFPLAYVPNVSVPDVPVSYASKGASDQDYTLVSFEPDQMQAQPAPASMGVGDTLSSLGRNVWDAVVYHTPAAVAAAVEGDDPYATWDWKDALIGRARQRAQEVSKPGDANTKTAIPGITAQDINSLGPSAGFSAAGAAAGLGAGIPAGMVASPVAGYAAGMAASGTTAYRMATNQFVRDLHDTVNAESLKTTGKPVSPQEFQAKQAQLADTIKAYGLWEAVPEAAGNALSFGILTAPVKGAIGKLFGKNIATRFAGKLGALYGEELATETVTQMGQHNAEVEAGMSKAPKRDFTSPSDWGESLREVAAPTILQTTLMAGGFKAGQMAKDRLFGKKDEAPPDDAIPAGDVGPDGGVEGEFIPASPSPALTKQPGPGNTYDQTNPALPPGQPLLPRPALPAPEQGGPTDRQTTTAMGLLKHSPKPSPELLQRLMRVDQTMATMLFNHWKANGQVTGNQATEIPAPGDQGQGADIAGSRVVGGFSDGAVSFTPGAAAEGTAPGGKSGMALGAAGPDAVALSAARPWDQANRTRRGDEWFEGARVNESSRAGFADALSNGGANLQAHGMGKERTLGGGIQNLLNMLSNGLDANRGGGLLQTAPLVSRPGEGLVGATASGSAYSDGPFMLVARPGESLTGNLSGLGAVLINQAHADIAPQIAAAIRAIRPDIIVAPYSEAGSVAKQLSSEKVSAGGTAIVTPIDVQAHGAATSPFNARPQPTSANQIPANLFSPTNQPTNQGEANGLQNQGQEAAQEVSSKFDPQGLQPGTPEYEAAFDSWAAGQQESKRSASLEQRRVDGQAAVDKKNGWRKRLVSWFETAKDGDTITTDIEGEEYLVVEKTIKRNGKEIVSKRLVLVGNDVSNDQTIIEYRDGKAYTGPNTSQGIDEFAGWAQAPETDIDSRAASLGKLLEEGIAKVGAGGTALDAAAHQAATSPLNDLPQPTEAQKQAGNYAKGHVRFQGMDISIENPAGSVRSGKDEDGKAWENTLQHHYGYIKGTIGRDKDHLDVFIKPGAQSARTAYVVDQINPKTGKFDEHKIVLGADSEADARAIYQANYAEGWQGMGAITAMPIEQFKDWIKSGKTKKPLAYVEPKGAAHAAKPKAEPPPAAAIDPAAPYGKVGVAPFSSQIVGLKDNNDGTATVMRGDEPFYDFENGDPVTVPTGATAGQIRQAVTDAGALSSRDKWFGVAKAETKPAETGTTPAGSGTEQAKPEAIAGKPVSDMPAEQLQKIASGESKTFGPAAVEKASAELARRDEVDSPKESKEPWQYGELEFGDKYIDETVLPDLRKQLANAHGGKFQEYPSKAAAVRGLKERIDTLENHRDAKARKYYASLDNHYGAVRAALADGKPVPPVAYESYEDLKADIGSGRIKGDGQEVARVEQPQHIEAGQAEPATAPVIAASLKESAKNTPMNIEQAREWLLSEIDKAIIDAKSAKEEGIWNRADDKVNLEGIMDVGATIGFKTFNVPGDGKFRVLNLKESLQKFKKQVAASPGFKKNATRPMSLASGNGGKTSVRDLLDDGEYVLAADYGHLTGKPLLFGAAISNNAHPVAYTDAEPVDIKGVDAQVGREWNQTGKSFMWRVIETTTGAMISSESTKEKAISKVLAKLDEHGVKKLIDIIKETPKVSQAELERQFTDWGSEEEARAQKQRDALERVDTEDRALWNSIWPLDDGKKRSPNPWNDINHMQVVILAKDAAKAGKGDEFVSLIERRRGGTNNVLALAARKALAEGSKPGKQSGGVDYKGFERTPTGNGNFTLKDGNLLVKVEAMGNGKFQASHGSAKSSPHINSEQGAVDWAANLRDASKKTTAYPFYSNNKLFNAEGTAELPKDWTGVARSDSGKRFFYLGQENGERSFNPLKAENYEDALKEAEGLKNDKPVVPEGYREVARGYFGGTVEKPIYAPFAEGERVRFIGGHAGNIQSFIGGPVTTGAIIKYDNGLTGRAEWRDVETAPAASIAGKPVSEMSDGMLNQIAKSSQPAAEKAKAEVARRKKPKADPLAAVREFYTPGNIIHVDYWNQYDKVLEFKEGDLPGQWNVKVIQVVKNTDGQWVPKDERMEPARWHSTMPGKDKIVDRVGGQEVGAGDTATKESGSQFSSLEKELAAKTHDTESNGDVGVVVGGGKVKYAALGDAVDAAKKAIASGTKANPFQIHNATGIRLGDVARVLAEAEKVGAGDTATAEKSSVAEKSAQQIEDFGEKIGGARKDVWSGFKDQIGEIPDDEIASQPFSKVWPAPDYQAMLDSGADPWSVAFMHAARDEVPAKPRAPYKVKRWAESVKLLRGMTTKILSGEYSVETVREKLSEQKNGLQKLASRVELYELVGHSKSLEGISFARHHYSIYRGREDVTLWAVEKAAKATAWSNWPTELATGDTKEEMLAAFKAKHAELNSEKAKSKEASFDIYSQGGEYFVGKKIGRNIMQLAGPFKTVKEARDHRTTHQEELSATLEKRKEIPQERRDTNNPRVGEDMRGGQDVTPQMFGEAFGFRGVEFGNWVEQGKRQSDLNEAYDALMDMAAILGVPPKALSLNGQLGLAFGARGTGGIQPAKAHYESDKVVINLTKKEGAGSLGHEWWHALDNYFSRIRAKNAEFMTEALDVSLASRDSEFIANTAVRKEMVAAFGKVIRAINGTALKARASKLDSKRTKEYWTTGIEMSARAFESYLISKLQDQNASNDYLANIVDEKTWKAAEALGFELGDSYPYPTAGEVPAIREAFDNFFRTVETKETDTGVAMFNAKSGSWGKPLDAAALEATIARVIAGSPSHFSRDTVITAPLFADLPAAILAKAKKEGYDANGRKPNGEKLTGATYDGKVYLVQENISSELEAEETLLHERIHQIVHGNAKDPDGIALRQSLGRLYLRLGAKSGIEHMAKEAGIDITGPLAAFPNVAAANRTAFLAEEFLAHAEGQRAYEKLPVKIKRAAREFWGEFRDWLRSSKFVRIAEALGAKLDDFTQSDLAWTLKGIRQQEAGTGSKAIRFMTAWHGSPHDHDGFDSSKIGTGEGAQAYGWGHYFAGAREVAEFYRNKLSARRDDTGKTWPRFVTYKGNTIDTEMASGDATPEQTAIMYLASNRGSAFQALQDLKQWEGLGIPDEARYLEAAKLIESGKINPDEIKADKGRLYQVELAPEPDEYLDWDKPLSEQSEKVREALIRAGVIVDGKYGDGFGATPMFPGWSTFTGESIHRRIVNHEFEKQREVTAAARKRAEQAASKYLHSIGIRGIKYLDGSSRNRPLKEIKAEFLSELPEDADTAEVMELVGTGRFSPKNEALIKALADDDWLGFDYPAQAISAALGSSLSNYDASPALLQAVSDAKDGGTHNYVIFSDADVKITAKESRASAATESQSVKSIKSVVDQFKREFKGAAALDIRVVQSRMDIPAAFRPSPYAEGVFHDDFGLIYLVADNITGKTRAFQILMHEAVGHYGLAAMMGERFSRITARVKEAARANGEVKDDIYQPGHPDYATVDAVRLRYPGATENEVAQEVLARMAETDPGRTLFGYVRAVVRQWLRDMARAAGIPLDVTTAELNDLVAQASRYMRRGDGVAQGVDVDALGVADMAVGGMASKATGMESRAAPTAGQPQEPRTGILDTILRKAGGELAAKITGPAYDKLTAFLGGKVPEGIKAGTVSDYGLDESYVDRRTGMQTEQQKAARQTKTFVEGLMDLDRAQSRVAYQWLNNRGAEADRLMAQLPQESQQVLKDIKIQIAKLTIEAVRLGQLDAETASRNFLAYLHRSYAKYDLNTDDKTWKAERAKAIKILGDQYKGRGLKMDVDPDRIHSAPGWWQDEMKGKRVQVLKNDAGRFAFVAEGTAIPPNLSGYKVEGVWEIRARKAADRITLWRDFTQDERQMMGELDEAKYAVARTLFMMNRDIEVGRFHEWVADEYAKTPEEAEEEGLQMADASDSMMHAFTPDEWVTVPTSKIPGTGVFKFGALAGMVVPGPVWNDIRQISAGRFEPFGAAYASILRAWKLSKTALTPTTHVNNIMGNFVMADMHDVGARDAIAAVRLMVAAANGDKDAKAMLDRFEDSGATQGMFTTHELKKEVLEPLLQQLREEVGMADDEAAILKVSAIMSLALHGQFGEAWAGAKAAAKQSTAGRVTGAVVTKAQDYYQAEDSVFRLAAFLKSIDEGKTDREAGKLARKAFLDYHINAPWINAMRGTAMPFIAFAYRAIPMLAETAARKPWKIAKYMLVAGGLNALAYAMLGADADEDKERAYLPEEKAGRLWGIVPKLIRMPWNRESKLRDGKTTSDPVFLDVRRWIPVGDVVDYGQDKTALPMIPQPLIPGGPLIMAAEFLVNKSAFTGKELTKETDTWVEKAAKVGGHFYKGFMPNVPIPYSGTWAGTKIDNAVKGREDPLGRAYPVPEAVASGFGLKLERYPVDTLQRNAVLDMKGKLRELSDAQRQAARDYGRQGMTKRELDEKVTEIVGKKNATIEEYKVKERKAMGR